jgi:hypothetical protein
MVAAYGLTVLVGAGLVIAVIVGEHDRWRAQDVFQWFYAGRRRRWEEDTGNADPSNEVAAAEVWLGAHQQGTVPQVYRAIAAGWTLDPRRAAEEVAAMPETTPAERALKLWAEVAPTWIATGDADTAEIDAIVRELPGGDDRSMLRSWLALVESGRRWMRRERGWIRPLIAEWPDARRERLGIRRRTRLWLSRFIVLPVFLVSTLVCVSLALTIADPMRQVPADYAETTIYTRGTLPGYDPEQVWITLPHLAAALPAATKADPAVLDPETIDLATSFGLPTLIWEIGRIDVDGPTDFPGHRVWSIEVLLGAAAGDGNAIITFDRDGGPAWLYRIDPVVVPLVRAAVGIDPKP